VCIIRRVWWCGKCINKENKTLHRIAASRVPRQLHKFQSADRKLICRNSSQPAVPWYTEPNQTCFCRDSPALTDSLHRSTANSDDKLRANQSKTYFKRHFLPYKLHNIIGLSLSQKAHLVHHCSGQRSFCTRLKQLGIKSRR